MHRVANRLVLAAALVWAGVCLAGLSAQEHKHAGSPEAAKMKNPVLSSPASIAEGQKSYEKFCKHCHGETGKGDGKLAPKGSMPSDFTDAEWEHGSTDGEIFHIISDGGGKGSVMKGFKSKMTAKEMWNVVNYLKSLGPKH